MIQLYGHKGLSLSGYSRAAHRTGLVINGLNILLDAGLDVQKAFPHIFITHQHLDHVIYLPQYTMNIENPEDSITVISSENILKNIKPYVTSALRMSKNIPESVNQDEILEKSHTKFTPISQDTNYSFINGMDTWHVNQIKCYHGIESIGFGFSIIKKKLKEEYLKLNGHEIKLLKDSGIEIIENKLEKIFIFLGDTNKTILVDDSIYLYKTIIIECSYIYNNAEEIKLAKVNKHMHWNDLEEKVKEYPHIQFILIHFSMRYTKKEIDEFFQEKKLTNVFYLI
jgi:ribonuclease Z